jgi:hypothetical protein
MLGFLGTKSFHEGDPSVGPIRIGLSPLFTPRFQVEVYVCRSCRHLEFFVPVGQDLRG